MSTINCSYITKTNNNCKIKAKEEYNIDNKYYCKKHYDSLIKKNTKENSIINCSYITKTNNNCKIKAKEEYNIDNKYYCKKHYDLLIKKNTSTNNKKNSTNTSTNNKNELITKIKKEIKLLNQSIIKSLNNNNKTKYKKDIFKLLLQIHPDKCNLPEANDLTKELTKLLEKIKLY
jgi:hypothetical protein